MWEIDLRQLMLLPNRVLTIQEVRQVLGDLHERKVSTGRARLYSPGQHHAWINLAIFRLAACCGLRSKEIRNLRLSDLKLNGPKPYINIRAEITKSSRYGPGRRRAVPLWWDKGTYDDIADYAAFLKSCMAPNPFVIRSIRDDAVQGRPMPRSRVADRWKTAISVLDGDRVKMLSIHCGRHTFCTHALRSGRSLKEVQIAAGHRWVSTTEVYLHALETGHLPDVFPEEDDE
jgi:integrase